MILQFSNKENFINNFLLPISKTTDHCVLKIEPGKISTLTASSDNTIVTYSEHLEPLLNETFKLNLPDVKKFIKLISCIDSELSLEINSNNITYKSPGVRFKYHLYDDGIIAVPPLNLDKISKIDFDISFDCNYDGLNQLMRGSSFTDDNDKIYLTFTAEGSVDAEITDKNKHNSNSFGIKISPTYEGNRLSTSYPLKFDILQHLTQYKADNYKIKLASKLGVFLIEVAFENTVTKFIISALKN